MVCWKKLIFVQVSEKNEWRLNCKTTLEGRKKKKEGTVKTCVRERERPRKVQLNETWTPGKQIDENFKEQQATYEVVRGHHKSRSGLPETDMYGEVSS